MDRVFGIHAVDSMLRRNPASAERLLVQSGREDKRIRDIVELARNQGVAVQRVPRKELDVLVNGRHQGAVVECAVGQAGAAGEQANLWSEAQLLASVAQADSPVLLLVLDGVTDPHNLGACLRSADAAGVHAVIVPKDKSADLGPTARKVACGAAETVPFVRVTNIARVLEGLKALGVWLYGTDGGSEQPLYAADFTGPVALVMGAEGQGMRRLTRESCDHLVYLPMAGSVSSLNVSVATGICLFEAVRQRASA